MGVGSGFGSGVGVGSGVGALDIGSLCVCVGSLSFSSFTHLRVCWCYNWDGDVYHVM